MNRWPVVTLGELLQLAIDKQEVMTDQAYPTFGVYGFGRGLFTKEPLSGSAISATHLFRVRSGQFVYSRLKAFEGAYALVTEEFDGRYVTNEFPGFDCDRSRLSPDYLAWYFRTPSVWENASRLSKGIGARRERLRPEQFFTIPIPLPSLHEQHRIVRCFYALAAKIEEATRLIRESDEGLAALCRSILHNTADGEPTPMSKLVTLRQPDVSVSTDQTYHFAGVYCFGGGVFVGQKKNGIEFAYPRLTRLHAGNFVYPKLMAWEGALAVVPPECDGLVVSTEFPVFEIDQKRVLPEVLDVYFRSPSVWPALSGASTGTNVRRKRLNPADFLSYRMPLPNRQVQERLRQAKHRVDQIKVKHQETAKELTAMLSAVLDRAFRGEI